jgi:RND family efflux transporter MFP subunit
MEPGNPTVRVAEGVPAVPPKRGGFGQWFILATGVLLAVWVGVRIHTATREQRRLAEERAHAAKGATKETQTPVRVVHGTPGLWLPESAVDGTLQAIREADLGFKMQGRLQKIGVKMGDFVKRGAVLATLDDEEAAAQVAAARAQLRAAEAQFTLSEDTERRTNKLVSSGAQSQATGVQVQGQRSLAAAQVDSAKAQLRLSATMLDSSTLEAPFSGYITKVPSGPGAVVSSNMTLFHLQDTSTLKWVGTIGEADAALVHPGAPIEIIASGRTASGTVSAVLGSVDPATRRVPIEAIVKNDGSEPLLSGTFVRAVIKGVREVPVLRLPPGALRPGAQNEVMLVENGRLRAQRVLFQPAPDGSILVRSGLLKEDTVLLGASPEAKDGDLVGPIAETKIEQP